MYTEVLRAISGIEIFPVISLIVFVAVFSGMLIWTARLPRRELVELSHLPLDRPSPGAGESAASARTEDRS
jgi:hypothetical protein